MRRVSPPSSELHRLRAPLTSGERRLFEVLDEGLEPDWEIYIQPHMNGLRPDFVLLHPKNGIAVFEVKDWALDSGSYRLDETGGLVVESGTDPDRAARIRSPMRQLLDYKYEIWDLYCPRLDRPSHLGLITAGLVLSNTTRDTRRRLEPALLCEQVSKYPDQFPVATAEDLEKRDLAAVFPRHGLAHPAMTEEVAADLRHWLLEPDFSEQQRRFLELDSQQRRLATTRTESGFRRMRGPAGAGKSLVVASRAAELCDQGKEVLIVSFNITLLNYLRDLFVRAIRRPDSAHRITFLNFHHLCKRLSIQLGLEGQYHELWYGDHQEILKVGLARFVEEAVLSAQQENLPNIDAVLVDEGQDFELAWWQSLRTLAGRSSRDSAPEMLLAVDATQDLYNTARLWTEQAMKGAGFSGPWSELRATYRLPAGFVPKLRTFVTRYLPRDEFVQLPEASQLELSLYPFEAVWYQVEPGQEIEKCFEAVRDALMRAKATSPLVFAELHRFGWKREGRLSNRGSTEGQGDRRSLLPPAKSRAEWL